MGTKAVRGGAVGIASPGGGGIVVEVGHDHRTLAGLEARYHVEDVVEGAGAEDGVDVGGAAEEALALALGHAAHDNEHRAGRRGRSSRNSPRRL